MQNNTPEFSRRRFLKQSFLFSAALATGVGRRDVVAEEVAGSTDQHLLSIGDWGSAEPPQKAVAQGMQNYIKNSGIKPAGQLLLGDNFYGPFKGGVTCPRWQTDFEDMYPKTAFPGPCWAMLGNHDYDEELGVKLEAELKYASVNPGTRWTMPSKWYSFEFPKENPLITFIVLDTNYHNRFASLKPEERDAQLAWFQSELEKPRKTPWLVVMGHHPLYSNGIHGDSPALIKDFDDLFRKHNVALYLCGHDHDLQHLEFEGHPTSFVLSGGGGGRIYTIKNLTRGPFAKSIYGFSHLQVNEKTLTLRHLDANAKFLHGFKKTPDGKMEVLS